MAESVLEVLVAARELISDPNRWCQGCDARTASGAPCASDYDDPKTGEKACKWCAVAEMRLYVAQRIARALKKDRSDRTRRRF